MILRERMKFLEELMQSARQVLEHHKDFTETAVRVLEHAKVYFESGKVDPDKIFNMYNRIHEMDMQSLQMLNSVIEKFPVEHTVQELQMLEIFRNLSERQRQDLLLHLEKLVLTKAKRK